MVVTYQTTVAFPVKYIVFEFGGITSVHLSSDRSRPGGFESKIPHATHRVGFLFLFVCKNRYINRCITETTVQAKNFFTCTICYFHLNPPKRRLFRGIIYPNLGSSELFFFQTVGKKLVHILLKSPTQSH